MNADNYLQSLWSSVTETQFEHLAQLIDYRNGIAQIMALVSTQKEKGHKIMFIGNGGSAGIASHCAIDYMRNGRMRSTCFNEGALLTCISNDYGYEHVFAEPIAMHADPGDILVAISSSGKSPNILNGVKAAKNAGCFVITLSGFKPDNPLRSLGDWNIYVPSDQYGFVELAHQIVLHTILDLIVKQNSREMISSAV